MNLPYSSVTDAEGNTYITGSSTHEDDPQGNIFTIKVAPTGEILWQVREPAPDFSVGIGYAITLDTNGHVIVSGSNWNGHDIDIRTIQYDVADGQLIWSADFDAGFGGYDYPAAVITDAQQNVIVAGNSALDAYSSAYSIVKYSPTGVILWQETIENEAAGSRVQPVSLAVDELGSFAVTGTIIDENHIGQFYTVKLNSSGELQWKRIYQHMLGDNPVGSVAKALAFDHDGALYVSGTFAYQDFENNRIGTVKYSAEGETLWNVGYSSSNNTLVGHHLKVAGDKFFAAGIYYDLNSFTEGSILLAYSLQGELLWEHRTSEIIVGGVKLVLDTVENPVTATWGTSTDMANNIIQCRKYDSQGGLLSQTNFQRVNDGSIDLRTCVALTIDAEDNLLVTNDTRRPAEGNIYELIKFRESVAEPQWVTAYHNQGGGNTFILQAQADQSGNTFVLGRYGNITGDLQFSYTYFIAKYDDSGTMEWKNDILSGATQQVSIGMTGENLVVLVSSYDSSSVAVQKYGTSGEIIWEYEKSLYAPDFTTIIAGQEDDIYLAGTSAAAQNGTGLRYTVIKLSEAGEEYWDAYIDSGNSEDNVYDFANAVVDDSQNLICATTHGINQLTVANVFSLSGTGSLNWQAPLNFGNASSTGVDLALNEDGSISIFSKVKYSGDFHTKAILSRLSASGQSLWQAMVDEEGHNMTPHALKSLPGNQVATVCSGLSPDGENKVIVTKFDVQGEILNTNATGYRFFYRDLETDAQGNIFVLSQAEETSTLPFYECHLSLIQASVLLIRDDNTSTEARFTGPNMAMFEPRALLTQADSRLVIAGNLYSDLYSFYGGYLFGASDELLATDLIPHHDKTTCLLGQNYPNPVTGPTTIPFRTIEEGEVHIALYDQNGRYVKTLAKKHTSAGMHEIDADLSDIPDGIYIYQLRTSNFKDARKIIIVKN